MLGQILLGIIIVLFLMGTGSIGISLWIDHDRSQYGSPVVYKEQKPSPVLKEVEYFYTEDEDENIDKVIEEEPKPISDILESFTMDDIEVDDDLFE